MTYEKFIDFKESLADDIVIIILGFVLCVKRYEDFITRSANNFKHSHAIIVPEIHSSPYIHHKNNYTLYIYCISRLHIQFMVKAYLSFLSVCMCVCVCVSFVFCRFKAGHII